MRCAGWPRSLSAAGLVASAILALAWGVPRIGLGQGGATPATGEGADLLKSAPFDRITLIDNKVLIVEPVSPRPLPPIETAKDKAKKQEDEPRPRPKTARKKGERAAPKDVDDDPANQLPVHLLEGEVRDFKVKRTSIKSVEYFEDMLLNAADRLIQARDFPRAFEHLLMVKSRNTGWKGVDERVNHLLYEEGSMALVESDNERGLRLLRELHQRQPGYPELTEKLAAAYSGRIGKAFEAGEYVVGRQALHELEQVAPNHALTREARERFINKARTTAEEADKRDGAEKLDGLAEALRIWPAIEGVPERFAEAFKALPTLDVGVIDLPKTPAPWPSSLAGDRVSRLLYLPILARDDEAALQGNVPGQIAAGLDKGGLGLRLDLRLKPGITWGDGSRPVSAVDVLRSLADRAEPRSPSFNARWSHLLERVEATDETQVTIRLSRPPLKVEDWLLWPVGPAHAGWDGLVSTPGSGRQPVGDGPYRWEGTTGTVNRYRSAPSGGPAGSGSPKIVRLIEHRLADAPAIVGALIRGEVSLVEHVPPDRVAALAKSEDLRVGRYNRPVLHRIALDGRTPALRNRSLRRGLSYAINRQVLLEETLLKQPAAGLNQLADGPFARDSYADAPGVKVLDYDPLLARMLVAAARKEMEGKPITLTLEYPAMPEAQAVVPKIVESFRLAGLNINAVARPAAALEEELRAGRRFDLAYRATPAADPAWSAGPLICPGYDAPDSTDGLAALASPRIMQLLLQLEHATEFPSARAILTQIDRESRDELPILPLWQLEDHYAWRTRLSGPAEASDHLYQGIETWQITPWFAKDPW